jgi:hypothetical protein
MMMIEDLDDGIEKWNWKPRCSSLVEIIEDL